MNYLIFPKKENWMNDNQQAIGQTLKARRRQRG